MPTLACTCPARATPVEAGASRSGPSALTSARRTRASNLESGCARLSHGHHARGDYGAASLTLAMAARGGKARESTHRRGVCLEGCDERVAVNLRGTGTHTRHAAERKHRPSPFATEMRQAGQMGRMPRSHVRHAPTACQVAIAKRSDISESRVNRARASRRSCKSPTCNHALEKCPCARVRGPRAWPMSPVLRRSPAKPQRVATASAPALCRLRWAVCAQNKPFSP